MESNLLTVTVTYNVLLQALPQNTRQCRKGRFQKKSYRDWWWTAHSAESRSLIFQITLNPKKRIHLST